MKQKIFSIIEKRPLILDGAMATTLYAKGVYINQNFEQINITAPNLVENVHNEYIKAGADAIFTNTFGANPVKLAKYGLLENFTAIVEKGIAIARTCARDQVEIFGSIGPLGIPLAPLGKISRNEAEKIYKEIFTVFFQNNITSLAFETFSDLEELLLAVDTARKVSGPGTLILAMVNLTEELTTVYGTSAETCLSRLEESAADIIGFNCSPGPHLMLRALEKIKKFPVKPVVVKPNAGTPREHEGRNFYMTSPEYFAEFAKRFIQNGVKVIGGCCGTNPEHIKAVRSAVKALFPAERTVVSFPEQNEKKPVGATPVPQPEKSALAAKLAAGQFVTSIEITPPRGVDPSSVIEKAAQCREAGIDAINIPDGPRASARLSPMITALRIQEKSGIEAVLHYCCRDRNIIGMQSDLLGAAAAGINNILSVTGDPPKLGDYPDATAVFDIDSIGLCRIISRLNHGLDIAGNPIGKPAKFLCGVGVNPGAIDLEKEMARLEQKISAGAEFIITQPVFDLEVFFRFYRIYEKFTTRIPLLAGIWPLASLRNAEFMNNEVPGAQVPEKIMERMRKKPSGEEAKNEGINIARESAREIKPLIQGLQVSAPFGNIRYALQVLDI